MLPWQGRSWLVTQTAERKFWRWTWKSYRMESGQTHRWVSAKKLRRIASAAGVTPSHPI